MTSDNESIAEVGKAAFWVLLGCALVILAMGAYGYLLDSHDNIQSKSPEITAKSSH